MIVFFLPDLRGGGAERVMLTLLKEFHENFNHEVMLLLGRKTGKLINEIPKGVRVDELHADSGIKSVLPFIRFCQRNKPQKVFASLGSSLATSLAKPFISDNIEIINRLGNTIGAEKLLFSSKIKQLLYIQANKLIGKNSDKLIFQCQYMANDFMRETKIRPKSYKVIYNPVNIKVVRNKSLEHVYERQFDFVSVGRLSPQKDYQTLLNAVHILKHELHKNWRFLVLGDGEQMERLKTKIKELDIEDQITLSGFTQNPYPYMKKAMALISTSLYEGFSNVIVESLTLGTPVVASDCPGANHEVIREGKDGFLFEVGNAENLARLLIEKYEKISILDRQAISEHASSRFNNQIIFQDYADYILS